MNKHGNTSVVVVEDDFLVSQEISYVLDEIGYCQIGRASDGLEGVEMVCKLKPDIVLMDIELPEIDGLEATSRIQNQSPTPIVIMTAYESWGLINKASEVGVAAYLIKPPVAGEIKRAASIAMARHQEMLHCRTQTDIIRKELDYSLLEGEKLRSSLKGKDALVREVYHRVKNNLMVLQSIIRLQSANKDAATVELLKDVESRLKSMSMLHEQLYFNDDMKMIRLTSYVSTLIRNVYNTYVSEYDRITTSVSVPDIYLDVDMVVPLGLIINELVSNAFKHAFKGTENGMLHVNMEVTDTGPLSLVVRDNGRGLPDKFDLNGDKSLGMRIVTSLAKQLNCDLDISSAGGSEFKLSFQGSKK